MKNDSLKQEIFGNCYWCGRIGSIVNHKNCWEELKAYALSPDY